MKTLLSPVQRRALRAEAHGLTPIVMIGTDGLTGTVMKEIERSLSAHELIKIRVFGDDREARAAWLEEICTTLKAADVQHIGKILVVWRENPALVKARAKAAARVEPKPRNAPRLTKRQEEAGAEGAATKVKPKTLKRDDTTRTPRTTLAKRPPRNLSEAGKPPAMRRRANLGGKAIAAPSTRRRTVR